MTDLTPEQYQRKLQQRREFYKRKKETDPEWMDNYREYQRNWQRKRRAELKMKLKKKTRKKKERKKQ